MTERRWPATRIATVIVVASLPLWPSGLVHMGLPNAHYADIGLILLLMLWLWQRWLAPRNGRDANGGTLACAPSAAAWTLFAAAMSGAAVVAMLRNNPIDSALFPMVLRDELLDTLLLGSNQGSAPLYPLRMWLVILEGWLAFLITRDLCRLGPDPTARARDILYGLRAGVAIVSVLAIAQYATRSHLSSFLARYNNAIFRTHATLEDPHKLAAFMLLGIGLALGRWGPRLRSRKGWPSAVLLALALLALATTLSRSALVGLAVASVVTLSLNLPALADMVGARAAAVTRRTARVFLVAGAVLFALYGLGRVVLEPVPTPWKTESRVEVLRRTLDPRTPLYVVLKGRSVWARTAAEMIKEHPVGGVGLGRFPRMVQSYAPSRIPTENAHNFYAQVGAEAGLFGLACLLLL
ncbi:MAG: O-antigen ligase family protein, partial [Planctomycetota bacterium]